MVAIVDDEKMGNRFMKFRVTDPARLDTISYDRILVTAINSKNAILQKIAQSGLPSKRVVEIS